ncbi:MAG TPA: autotransporter-associated beta strand repeat-containing protein, partial [Chitinispirillaceae bacterium]|nr:autotransporter-associated beta strand repeat-containing protein [Chitinispirillaceae bacterium]
MIFLKKKTTKHLLLFFLLLLTNNSFASKKTLDADGGADYTSFDDAINAVVSQNLDTLLIIGNDKDAYSWTAVNDGYLTSLYIRSTQTVPDSFPVITRTGASDLGNLFRFNDMYFENLVFDNGSSSAAQVFSNGEAGGKIHKFKNCVIRNTTSGDFFFLIFGSVTSTVIFENCLFHNNTRIISCNYWSGAPTISFLNCTFDANGQIFDVDEDNNTSISFVNCIFSGNTTTFPAGTNYLRSKVTYSLTSEPITNYGSNCVSSSDPQYIASSRSIPSHWKIGSGSLAAGLGTSSGTPATDISGASRSGNYEAGCWEIILVNNFWDISASADYQAGSGIWSATDDYWTTDGINLNGWNGRGNAATFAGTDGTNYNITVSGSQDVDSISFNNSGYTISSGTLNFITPIRIRVAALKSATINSVITGGTGFNFIGSGTLTLNGSNTFGGVTTILDGGTLTASVMANGGSSSSIGNSSNAASNFLINSGTFVYSGTGATTDRLFTIGTSGAGLVSNGSGTLNFSNTGSMALSGSGTRTLTLQGTNNGSNTIAAVIGDNGGATSIVKSGTGKWVLTGGNSYTGTTTINGGTLQAAVLASGGSFSSIGSSANTASNLVINGGVLSYYGVASSLDRLFTIGTSGAEIDASGSGALNFSNTGSIALSGSGTRTLTLNGTNSATNTIAALIGDNGGATSLVKNGTGQWVLSGSNTFTGAVTLNYGTLSVSNLAAGGMASNIGASANSAGNLIFNGGTLIYTGGSTTCNRLFTMSTYGGTWNASGTGELNLSNSGSVVFTGSGTRILTLTGTNTGNNTFAAVLGDNGGATYLTKTGTGTWIITGSHLYSGITSVNGGILAFSGSGSVYSNGTVSGSILIDNSGTLRLDRNNFLGLYTTTSPVSVTINAGGTLSSNNSFTTLTNPVLNGGTISSNGGFSATLPSFALKGNVSVTGTAISTISDAGGSNNRIMLGTNVTGGVTEFNVADVTMGNDLQVSTVLCNNIDAGDMLEVSSGLTKSGTGTMLLNAGNTYKGPTTINAGTIVIGASGSLYSTGTYAGTVIINNGGTLRFDRNNSLGDHLSAPAVLVTVHQGGVISSNSTFNTINNLALNGGTLTANGGDATWGAFALKGTVRAYGSAVSTISTGGGANNGIRIGTNVVDGATTFDISDNASGTDLAVSAVLIDNKGPDPYPDVAGGIIKNGPGTMALSSVNTYTGSTVVSNGTLLVNGSTSSSSQVTVNKSGVIGGSGIIGGSVSVADSGAISPGNNGIGTLTTGNLGLNNQSILNFELGTTALSDKIVINQGAGDFTADGILNVTSRAGFSYGTYTIISCTGNLVDNTITLGTTPAGFSCDLQVVGKDVQLVVTEINQAPTDILISSTEVFEGKAINTIVGTLSTTDVNTSESFTYSLVEGAGSTDNASFNISGNQLRTSEIFNYAAKSTYNIRVRSSDHEGLTVEKTFVINVIVAGTGLKAQYFDNNDFTNLKVNRADANVNFDWAAGAPDLSMGSDDFSSRWIGKILPKYTQTYTFYVSSDDGVRLWVNNQLVINQWIAFTGVEYSGQIDLTGGTLYDIKVEFVEYSSDASIVMSWECPMLVKEVVPQDYLYVPSTSPPTDITLSNSSVYEGRSVGTTVGTLTTTDPDGGSSYNYSLVGGTGSTDNANFVIDGNTLKTNAILDNATKASHSIRIRTTDATGFVYDKEFTITVTADPTVITIDADGGADYISLNAALVAVEFGSNPNTIVFIGSDQDNYDWSFNVERQIPGPLTIKGLGTDPDSFTVINRATTTCSAFFSNLDISFENLIFTGNIKFSNGNSGKTITFTNCVIRDFNSSDYFLELSGDQSPVITFNNCLFEGNSCVNGIFGLLYTGGTPDLNLINCTFDNNNMIFSSDDSWGKDYDDIKNCIFINNSATLPGANLKARTTYTLTSESTTGYGTGCIEIADPLFVTSTRDIPSDWLIKNISPARDTGTNTGAPGTDLGNASRNDGHADAGCFEFVPYTWDLQTVSGTQSGDGTWGTNNYWSREGTKLVAWPDAGNSARFAGADSTYTITVNGIQSVEKIFFASNGYQLTSGALSTSGNAGINISSGKTATIGSLISGMNGLNITGGGTLILQGTNTYTGVTSINGGTVVTVTSLSNGGQNSQIGKASASAANLIINNGTLRYTGNTIDIDRLFSIGNNGCTIDASGSGSLNFTGADPLGFDGSGIRTLTLTGTGSGSIKPVISDNVSVTSLVKSGSGTWTLSGTNTFTGTTTVSELNIILLLSNVQLIRLRSGVPPVYKSPKIPF